MTKFTSYQLAVVLLATAFPHDASAFSTTTPRGGTGRRSLTVLSSTKEAEEVVVTTRTSENQMIQHRDYVDMDAWKRGFDNVEDEVCYELSTSFPTDLVGTFFQNGHAKFRINDEEFVAHPFDADGMIQAVTFPGDGTAWFRNRYIQTEGYVKEKKAGKWLYRGVFGTAKNKGKWYSNIGDLNFKNVANTHVLYQGDSSNNKDDKAQLLALWEAGLPHIVDPTTLETKGTTTLEGTLDETTGRYAAHYKKDPVTNTICNFAIGQPTTKGRNPIKDHSIQVFEHDADTGKLVYQKSYDVDGFGVAHDCAVTENYFIFLQTPSKLNPLPLLLGLRGAAECIEFQEDAKHARLILVPRGKENEEEPISVDVPMMWSFHTSNAFEKDGKLYLDMIAADRMLMSVPDKGIPGYPHNAFWELPLDFEADLPKYDFRRLTIDLKTKTYESQYSMSKGICGNVEFPVINPNKMTREYQYSYIMCSATTTTNAPLQGLAKVDTVLGTIVQKWLPDEPHQFLVEPSFVPRRQGNDKDEDSGYLITYLIDGTPNGSGDTIANELLVFDAKNIAQGPISRSKLQGACINHSLHGTFVPQHAPKLTESIKATFAK